MKQTEHFCLNQWELTDRIRMEDFNADNAKIAAELARLRRDVFALAYYIGQYGLALDNDDKLHAGQHYVLSAGFHHPDHFTCTGGVTVQDHKATLTGKNAVGTVTTNRIFFADPTGGTVTLWLHHKGGDVVPYINGKAMALSDQFSDGSPSGGFGNCKVYTLETPYTSDLQVMLEMSCGNSSSMQLFDFFLARL